MNTLNVTNGDAAVAVLERDGIAGRHLPWRDALHDGPVPPVALRDRAGTRCRFLCDWFGEPDYEYELQQFGDRNAAIGDPGRYGEIVLWFEHDLYDQLQLLEVLEFLASLDGPLPPLWLVNPDAYLGEAAPGALARFRDRRVRVGEGHFELARTAWRAFTAPRPAPLLTLLGDDGGVLPHLAAAIARLLAEYPHPGSGLSATEAGILDCLVAGPARPGPLFRDWTAREDPKFMGDWSFFAYLDALITDPRPLIETVTGDPWRRRQRVSFEVFLDQPLRLTALGERVAAGDESWLEIRDYRRSIGGVDMDAGDFWTFDPVTARLDRHRRGDPAC